MGSDGSASAQLSLERWLSITVLGARAVPTIQKEVVVDNKLRNRTNTPLEILVARMRTGLDYEPDGFNESYDWDEVLNYASQATIAGKPSKDVPGYYPIGIDRIVAWAVGMNDGPNWLLLVALKDGRFAYTSAGCDYTGWDCQGGGSTTIHNDFATLVMMGIPEDDRNTLSSGCGVNENW